MSVCSCCSGGGNSSHSRSEKIEEVSDSLSKLFAELDNHLEDSSSWEEGLSLGLFLLRNTPACKEKPSKERRKAEKCVLASLRMRTIDPGSYCADPWTCAECWGVLRDPVTLKCGHSLCQECLSISCPKCGVYSERDPNPSVNVLINELVHKYWTPELKAVSLKKEGNELFKAGHLLKALEAYSEAANLNPVDASIRNNRSNAYFKLNEFEAALSEAETAIKLRPNWTKAYYRKSAALRRLGREEEAFKTLYQCLILDKDPSILIQNELCSLLTNMNLTSQEEVDEKTLKILERFPALKAKQKESKKVVHLIKEASQSIEKFLRAAASPKRLPVNQNAVDPTDFECSLCLRLFWEPITTPCGHTFCKSCLDRTLDHKPFCALCKHDLAAFLATRNGTSCEFIIQSLRRLLPDAYDERKRLHEQETRDLIGKETPIFVCTMSFPSIPCPLHVYEPRYRLMIRRAMETGTREFGMCPPGTGNEPFADYGTMLEVKNVKYFPDGRSIVGTVGGRRFHVLSRSTRDGYNVANVEFLVDKAITDEEVIKEVKELHDATHKLACDWFNSMKPQLQEEITSHFGSMPDKEPNYWKLSSGPSWIWWALAILPLDQKTQIKILSQTSLQDRLKSIKRILNFLSRKNN